MAKAKNMSEQAIRNRNNRARGAKFEKLVAKILDMYIVPYSGSNARFGFGDIRDVEGIDGGLWLGECKSMQVDDESNPVYVIDHKWLSKNKERASLYNALPFLAFTRFAKPHKWIMIDEYVYTMLESLYNPVVIPCIIHPIQMANRNMRNYHIPESALLAVARCRGSLNIWFKGDSIHYYIMSLTDFYGIITTTKIHAKYGVKS